MRKLKLAVLAFVSTGMIACFQQREQPKEVTLLPIEDAILNDSDSHYYIDFAQYPAARKQLPIGVFDSGTGGLTVLDAIVRFDEFDNDSKQSGADGVVDFRKEDFIYLADQANMPYGNYHAAGKTDLLQEHIIKDFQFLFANKYYLSGADSQPLTDKKPVKAIVVACNTATAYGYKEALEFVEKADVDVPIIGVINAAVNGTLSQLDKKEDGAIGVFATVGTIASEGYEKTIRDAVRDQGYTGNIQIVNQGGHGLAEAIDGEVDYLDRKTDKPRESYRGPALDNDKHKIEKDFLAAYNFNFDDNQMLCDTENADDCSIMQINSPENYVRYHLVSMMNNLRNLDNPQPLKALILGCTHYPYMIAEIKSVLAELREFYHEGERIHPYQDLIADEVHIIDPAVYVARELFEALKDGDLFNDEGDMLGNSEFYISVPNTQNSGVELDEAGRFTYDYKYGRTAGNIQEYVKPVPFDKDNIPSETLERLQQMIPETFTLIRNFSQQNAKLASAQPSSRIN